MDPWTLKIVLPVGISFYTFHGLSYVIDIYKERITPTRNWNEYSVFVSYFPLLVAGPIERATHLLPQIERARIFQYSQMTDGIKLITWGLFKKIVIADTLAPVVNDIFKNYLNFDGGSLLLGAIYFSFQIYCDFSGYSDIARGVSKLFGMELLLNFNFPYFSRSIPEFWRRWHISLSSWFKDYVYIPLGGSRTTKAKSIRNVFIIFLLSGFWHGANWTFIVWGGIHAALFLPSFIFKTNRKYIDDDFETQKWYPSILEFIKILFTFTFVMIAWIFFRSDSLFVAFDYLKRIFIQYKIPSDNRLMLIYVILFISLDILIKKIGIRIFYKNYLVQLGFIIIILYYFLIGNEQTFIYFNF
jgi:D-alanyl-lipoteichoic acid acyltransferase DltB (MBOAT superfamily)